MLKPLRNYSKTDMGKEKKFSQYDSWDDDFDRAKKKRSNKKSSDYKRKSKYKNNYYEDDY